MTLPYFKIPFEMLSDSRWELDLEGVFLDGQELPNSKIMATGGVNSTRVSALVDSVASFNFSFYILTHSQPREIPPFEDRKT